MNRKMREGSKNACLIQYYDIIRKFDIKKIIYQFAEFNETRLTKTASVVNHLPFLQHLKDSKDVSNKLVRGVS